MVYQIGWVFPAKEMKATSVIFEHMCTHHYCIGITIMVYRIGHDMKSSKIWSYGYGNSIAPNIEGVCMLLKVQVL